jgi:hypothetical protein
MLSHSLSFESLLVNAIGLLILFLLITMVTLVARGSDLKNDAEFEPGSESRLTSVMERSRNKRLEIEQNIDAT